MRRLTCFLSLLIFVNPFQADACRIVSLEKNPANYIQKMIKTTPDIYWSEATSYSKEDEKFTFKVLETLKGEKKKSFTLHGTPSEGAEVTNDFNSHKDNVFWNNVVNGRNAFDAGCRMQINFQVGSRYLIFNKEPFQTKSFELVKTKKDKWFQHVYQTLYPPKKIKIDLTTEPNPAEAAPKN